MNDPDLSERLRLLEERQAETIVYRRYREDLDKETREREEQIKTQLTSLQKYLMLQRGFIAGSIFGAVILAIVFTEVSNHFLHRKYTTTTTTRSEIKPEPSTKGQTNGL